MSIRSGPLPKVLSWRRGREKHGAMARREARDFYLFIAPWLIGFLVFTLGPMVATLYWSFNEYSIVSPSKWIGLANYQKMIGDDLYWRSLWNTVYYTIFFVPLGIVGSLFLAVLLNQRVPGLAFFRTAFYLPTVVPAVSAAVLWLWLLNARTGLINYGLELAHITGPAWLADPSWAKPALILMNLWVIGGPMVIFLAGLQNIPPELYEAAELDGAGWLTKFLRITVPMLSSVIFFVTVLMFIASFQVFTAAYVMTGGGPQHSTRFYMLYLYQNAFGFLKIGYASAMAWVLFTIIVLVTVFQFKVVGRWVYYESGGER